MFISSAALRKTSSASLASAGIMPCIAGRCRNHAVYHWPESSRASLAGAGIKPGFTGRCRNLAVHHWPESSQASPARAGIKPCITGQCRNQAERHWPELSHASRSDAGIRPSITGRCRNQAVPPWPESNRASLAGACAPLVVLSDLQARGCDPSRQGPLVPCVAARGDRALTDCLSLLGDRLAAASVMVAGLIAPETSPWQRAFSQTGC